MGTTAGVTANHHTAEAPSPLIFLDTEFVETDSGVRFISAALVTDAGSEFYSELPLSEAEELLAQHPNDFVRSEVIPQLGLVEGTPWSELPKRLAAWLDSLDVQEVQVIYDFNADYLLIEQALTQLASPPAVRLIPCHVGYPYDYFGHQFWVVYEEYLAGGTFEAGLAKYAITPDAVRKIGVRLAEVLEHLDEKRLVHRDIKPANIMFRGNGDPVKPIASVAHASRECLARASVNSRFTTFVYEPRHQKAPR